VSARLSAPGPQEKRFAAYIEGLATAAGHEDRHAPLKDYCKGLLLPGERKSVEPMAGMAQIVNCDPGSPPFASARRIATTKRLNLALSSGY